jgi:hypothetical protein
MAAGPGKYDTLATHVRVEAQARAAIVIVIGGNLGDGFSVQCRGEDITQALPSILRRVADDIEEAARE